MGSVFQDSGFQTICKKLVMQDFMSFDLIIPRWGIYKALIPRRKKMLIVVLFKVAKQNKIILMPDDKIMAKQTKISLTQRTIYVTLCDRYS